MPGEKLQAVALLEDWRSSTGSDGEHATIRTWEAIPEASTVWGHRGRRVPPKPFRAGRGIRSVKAVSCVRAATVRERSGGSSLLTVFGPLAHARGSVALQQRTRHAKGGLERQPTPPSLTRPGAKILEMLHEEPDKEQKTECMEVKARRRFVNGDV